MLPLSSLSFTRLGYDGVCEKQKKTVMKPLEMQLLKYVASAVKSFTECSHQQPGLLQCNSAVIHTFSMRSIQG